MADHLMAGVLDSNKRRKGWMTSADVFDREKLREASIRGVAEIERHIAEYNAGKLAELIASPAHRRLLVRLTDRWIKGTGFVHRSVVCDLVDHRLADIRFKGNERYIRISDLGHKVRSQILALHPDASKEDS